MGRTVSLALLLVSGAAFAQAPIPPPGAGPNGVVSVMHDANGHTIVTRADGTQVDDGIANTRGNATFATLGTSGVQAMPLGAHYGWVAASGEVPSLSLRLPPTPQINDIARLGSPYPIDSLVVQDASGNPVASASGTSAAPAMPGLTVASFSYQASGWVVIQMPQTGPVRTVAGRSGDVVLTAADVPGVATAASLASAISALNLGTASTHAFADFYSPSNPQPCAAATAATLGCVKSGISLFSRTTSPISVTLGAVSLLGAGLLPSVSVPVPGVSAGDFVLVSYAGTAPTNITIAAAQATAANTVQVTPAATQALTVGSQSLSLNFAWMH